jgi:hypothetical protein
MVSDLLFLNFERNLWIRIRDLLHFLPRDLGSGIGFPEILDPGSYHYFCDLKDNLMDKILKF